MKPNTKSAQCILQESDRWSFHFWQGIKYGYSLCCILWWCDSLLNNGQQTESMFDKVFIEEYTSRNFKEPSDRNLCPECLMRRLSS